jgi:hypothetical protein
MKSTIGATEDVSSLEREPRRMGAVARRWRIGAARGSLHRLLGPSNTVDSLQEEFERCVGDQVIERYNADHGTSFRFHGRAGQAPDLITLATRLEARCRQRPQ